MSTVRVLRTVSSKPDIVTEEGIRQLEAKNYTVYRYSTANDMRDSLATGSSVEYVAMKPDGPAEDDVIGLLRQYKCDLEKRTFMDDVHNLKAKAQGALYDEFLQSVIANLRPVSYVQLVKGCSSFKAFTDALAVLHEDKRNAIVSASKVFCERYNLEPWFWEQSIAVEGLNTDRNVVSHRNVAQNAAAIIQAAKQPDEYPEADVAWAMLGALANYSATNADALEAAAWQERQRLASITERYRQRLKQQ